MRSDLNPEDRHEAGYRWATEFETEIHVHNLVGFHWDLANGITGCDTAWMLAHVCPRTRRSARSLVLRAIAGMKIQDGIRLLTPVTDAQRRAAAEALIG